MKPLARFTALAMAVMLLCGAALAGFDVLTHENMLTNPELKFAGGWLMTALTLFALALRGGRRRSGQAPSSHSGVDRSSPR